MFCRRHGFARDDLAEHRLRGRSRVRWLTDQHLVQNGAECVCIGGGPNGLITCSLLRAHVKRRAHAEAGFGEPGTACDAESQCDPEIGHHWLSVLKQNVGGLEPIGPALWQVYFGPTTLGWFDEELFVIFDTHGNTGRNPIC